MKQRGFDQTSTLLATSCCPDEINRDLDADSLPIGRAFSMGGLAGFPAVGATGVKALAHHVPEGGCVLVICASHVGIDAAGAVGRIRRHGMREGSSACGSAVAAYRFCEAHRGLVGRIAAGDPRAYPAFADPGDAQQNHVQQVPAPSRAPPSRRRRRRPGSRGAVPSRRAGWVDGGRSESPRSSFRASGRAAGAPPVGRRPLPPLALARGYRTRLLRVQFPTVSGPGAGGP